MSMPIPAIPGLGGGANKFAAGNKTYGAGQISAATTGPVEKTGYLDRERKRKLRQLAMQNALGQPNTPDTLGAAL